MGGYGFMVNAAMAGWYPLCFTLFMMMPPARAVAVALVGGFLLLPNVAYDLPGFPNYDKGMAIVLGAGLASALVDSKRFMSFRARLIDAPIAILCLSPFVSALANGDGAYLGASNAFDLTVRWALPWFLGRIYFTDFESQKFLGKAIVIGALAYVPFALWEVKMSPQIHFQVYKVMLRSFKHAHRAFGLWRPSVFVTHGLAYALFNSLAALVAFWMWRTRCVKHVFGIPMGFAAGVLTFMAVAAQSSNAILLMGLGITCLLTANRYRRALPLVVLLWVPLAYVTLRLPMRWDGEQLVAVAESVFGPARAESLRVRVDAEAQLRDRILEKPWVGYTDFKEFTGNRGREVEQSPILVDSRWILYLGLYGVFALIGLWGMQLLPAALLWRRLPTEYWSHPVLAPAVVLGIASLMITLDGLLNAFEIQAFTAGAGGVAWLFGTKEGTRLWQA